MTLHSAGHRRGVVAAPHVAAVEDGRMILSEGGNAIEAMLAMAASIAAVYPHMNHIGGDGFWLIRAPSGRIRALMGAGRAGAKATPRFYRDAGYDEIPPRGPLAALTVPGAVGAWMLAQEAAKAQGGKLPLGMLLAPAIRHARNGYEVARSQARLTAEKLPEMDKAIGFGKTFLVDGKAPDVGARLKQTEFAATLEHLAHAGLGDFYRGDVGREIAGDLERIGSPVTRADVESYRATVDEPLSVMVEAGTLYNSPPPTQGLASLMILALFARLRVGQAESFEHIHGLIEATKCALRVRDRVITDPDKITADLSQYLAPAYLDAEAAEIDGRKAARWPAPYGEGDTVWMGARTQAVSSSPTFSRSIGSSAPAACFRPPAFSCKTAAPASRLMQRPRTRLRPVAVPSTRSILRSLFSRTDASWATAPWAAMASRKARRPCSRATSRSVRRSTRRSMRRAGCSDAPGDRHIQTCEWSRVSTGI